MLFFINLTSQGQIPNFTNLIVSSGWDEIEGFVWDATGQQYVWEKGGRVWVVDTNGVKQANPLVNISEEVGNWRDHGLNGFALDPDFRNNGFIYLYYTVDRHHLMNFGTVSYNSATNTFFEATIARVTRYTCDPATNFTTLIPGSRHILIGTDKKNGIPVLHESHSGGTLIFGTDGSLLVSTGDGAAYNWVDSGFGGAYWNQALMDSIIRPKENVGSFRSQIVDCLNGKILRIHPGTGEGLGSNPYYDPLNPSAPKSKVWALGLRNPFRVTLKPGTGETDISAGEPGILYIGDVGWDQWEEIDVNDEPGQNFGWPLYEGLTPQSGYQGTNTVNQDMPNPLFGTGGCTQQFLRFKDLVKQATLDPDPFFRNPCDSLIEIPDSIQKFNQVRPIIDYEHGVASTRTGIFNGLDAAEIEIADSLSPVQGTMFGGYASMGGLWYNDNRFPVMWQNTYFHGDYVGQWIRNFVIDSLNQPSQVRDFWDNNGVIVYLALNPKNGCISYVNYPEEIKQICYTGVVNNLPVIVMSADTTYGAAPFAVQFNGSLSSDPENQPLTFKWKFGDGDSSSVANPVHIYNPAGGQPISYYAKLTVTDNVGQSVKDSILISINNTPPQVAIISFNDGDLYSMNGVTNWPLQAAVTDSEHGPGELFYEWTTYLHHNAHTHIEEVDTNKITSTVISPIGCEISNSYNFSIKLKVTDAEGLSTTVESSIFPSCTPPVPNFTEVDNDICAKSAVQFTDLSTNFPVQWQWSFPGGIPSSSTVQNPLVLYNTPGSYQVQLIVSGAMGSDTLVLPGHIKVNPLPMVTIASSDGTNGFCPENTTYKLNANTSNNIVSWDWTRYTLPIGSSSSILPLTKGGNYKVLVTNIWGCTKLSSKFVVTKYAPAIISVTASGPLTFCPGDSVVLTAVTNYPSNTFSWKNYANIIPGATSNQYTAYTSGKYKALATTTNNCVRASSPFLVDATCLIAKESGGDDLESTELLLFPNPASTNVNVAFKQEQGGDCTIELMDVTGRRQTLMENTWFDTGTHQLNLEIGELVPGVYQVILIRNNQIKMSPLVIGPGN